MNLDIKIFDFLPDDAKMIREKVFVDEQGFTEEFDSVDLTAKHFVVYDGKHPIGTCRIFPGNDNSYIIGRIAVIKDFRGRGIGRKIMSAAEHFVFEIGAHDLKLHSQYRARDFYEKCGYIAFGEIDYEEDCPHIWMQKILCSE